MSNFFDELLINKTLCYDDINACISKLNKELVIYKDVEQSKTKELYTKLITHGEYLKIKTFIIKRANDPEYNLKIRDFILTKLDLYKEIKLASTSTDTVKDIANLGKLNEIVKLERHQQPPVAALNPIPHVPTFQPTFQPTTPQPPIATLKAKESEASLINISYSKEAKELRVQPQPVTALKPQPQPVTALKPQPVTALKPTTPQLSDEQKYQNFKNKLEAVNQKIYDADVDHGMSGAYGKCHLCDEARAEKKKLFSDYPNETIRLEDEQSKAYKEKLAKESEELLKKQEAMKKEQEAMKKEQEARSKARLEEEAKIKAEYESKNGSGSWQKKLIKDDEEKKEMERVIFENKLKYSQFAADEHAYHTRK